MNRPAALFLVTVAVAIAVMAVGCGSGDGDDGTPTSGTSRTVEAGGSPDGGAGTPPEAPSATPIGPSETPEPTSTTEPTATPTVAEVTFDRPDASGGTKTDASMGPLGIVYADSAYGALVGQNRAQASAWVNVGINERPSASAWLSNNFRVPGDGTTPVSVQISTGANWQGVLAGNGAGGTFAAVTITLSVLNGSTVVASEEVHSLEQREAALTVGGFGDIDRADVDMQVALAPGVYELRLTVTCNAGSGLLGAATHCIYGPSEVYDDGFVAWETRTILFGP
jgi:hypothetical protein